MRLDLHELTTVVAAITPAAVRSRQEGADAVVGNNALRRFNVIFDYANRKLHIRPDSHFHTRGVPKSPILSLFFDL